MRSVLGLTGRDVGSESTILIPSKEDVDNDGEKEELLDGGELVESDEEVIVSDGGEVGVVSDDGVEVGVVYDDDGEVCVVSDDDGEVGVVSDDGGEVAIVSDDGKEVGVVIDDGAPCQSRSMTASQYLLAVWEV